MIISNIISVNSLETGRRWNYSSLLLNKPLLSIDLTD